MKLLRPVLQELGEQCADRPPLLVGRLDFKLYAFHLQRVEMNAEYLEHTSIIGVSLAPTSTIASSAIPATASCIASPGIAARAIGGPTIATKQGTVAAI